MADTLAPRGLIGVMPPAGLSAAANDLGRTSTSCGPPPVNLVLTSVVPPNTGSVHTMASPSSSTSTLLVITVRFSLTERRPATSRPV